MVKAVQTMYSNSYGNKNDVDAKKSGLAMMYFCKPTQMLALYGLVPSVYGIFSTAFWNIAENNICGIHKFMILTHFVKQDTLHRENTTLVITITVTIVRL